MFAAHNGDAVSYATVVLLKKAICRATYFGVHRVGRRLEVAACFEHRFLIEVGRISHTVGLARDLDFFRAAAIAFVVGATLFSAFQVFHNVPPEGYISMFRVNGAKYTF